MGKSSQIVNQFLQELEGKPFDLRDIQHFIELLPNDSQGRNAVLNPSPPIESPLIILGRQIAQNKINIAYIELIKAMMQAGGDPNVLDRNGFGIMHYAASAKPSEASERLFLEMLQHPAVNPRVKTTHPTPDRKNVAHLLYDAINTLEFEDNAHEAILKKTNQLVALIEQGHGDLLFETPQLGKNASIPSYMKTLNPANMMYKFVEQTLLKGQSKDVITHGHESVLKPNNKNHIIDYLITRIHHETMMNSFLQDILIDPTLLQPRDKAQFEEAKENLKILLNNPKTKPSDVQRLIDNLPSRLKQKNADHDHLMRLINKRHQFAHQVEQQIHDYNNMKTIGHCLGLRGLFENGQRNVVSYEEFDISHTLPRLAHEADMFLQHISKSKSGEEINLVAVISESFRMSAQAKAYNSYSNQAQRYLDGLPVMIPCLYAGHFASVVLHGDRLYFSNKDSGCTTFPGIECYQINLNASEITENEKMIESLNNQIKLMKRQASEILENKDIAQEVRIKQAEELTQTIMSLQQQVRAITPNKNTLISLITQMSTQKRYEDGTDGTEYHNLGLPAIKQLEPKLIYQKKLHGQKQGNCSYTNNKRAFEAMILALQDNPTTHDVYKNIDARELYNQFSQFDRLQTIREHFQYYKRHNKQDDRWLDPIFKYLRYKTILNNPHKVEVAQYILKQLRDIGYTDVEIAEHMLSNKYPPKQTITRMINIALDYKEGRQLEGREEYFKTRANRALFEDDMKQVIDVLKQAGLSNAGLRVLEQHKQRSPRRPPSPEETAQNREIVRFAKTESSLTPHVTAQPEEILLQIINNTRAFMSELQINFKANKRLPHKEGVQEKQLLEFNQSLFGEKMELLNNILNRSLSLRDLILSKSVTPEEIQNYIRSLEAALELNHEINIAHGCDEAIGPTQALLEEIIDQLDPLNMQYYPQARPTSSAVASAAEAIQSKGKAKVEIGVTQALEERQQTLISEYAVKMLAHCEQFNAHLKGKEGSTLLPDFKSEHKKNSYKAQKKLLIQELLTELEAIQAQAEAKDASLETIQKFMAMLVRLSNQNVQINQEFGSSTTKGPYIELFHKLTLQLDSLINDLGVPQAKSQHRTSKG